MKKFLQLDLHNQKAEIQSHIAIHITKTYSMCIAVITTKQNACVIINCTRWMPKHLAQQT